MLTLDKYIRPGLLSRCEETTRANDCYRDANAHRWYERMTLNNQHSTNHQMNTMLMTLAGSLIVANCCSGTTNASPRQVDPLVVKYDANNNGKIDINERKGYVRELASRRRAEVKAVAAQRPKLNYQERLFYRLPRLTPELIQRYDTNHNGRIDIPEQAQLQRDSGEAAKQEFRRFDRNADGKLDKQELKAAEQAQQTQREVRLDRAREARRAQDAIAKTPEAK
jgi:Ca2+-binding EF-hand superfamily protein